MITGGLLNSFLQQSGAFGTMIIAICDCCAFTYHSLNFVIIMLTNKRFAGEVKKFFHTKFNIRDLNTNKMQKAAVIQDSGTLSIIN